MLELAAQLLLTYALHSSLLLGAVWAAEGWLQRRGLAEFAWRAALLGAWASSLLALGLALRPLPAEPPMPRVAAAVPSLAVPPPIEAGPTTAPRPAAARAPNAGWAAPLAALTLLWLAVALLALLRLALQAARLSLQARRLPPWPDARLRAPPGLRLHLSPTPSPWAWGRRVGLPPWLLQESDAALREAVLAHEVAHLQRRDPAWRLLSQAAALLGWLQPLNRLALRRLDALMEADCDRRAAARTGAPQALAAGLLRCAEQLRAAPALPSPAILMLGAERPLLTRLQLLLEPPPMSLIAPPHARWWIAGGLLFAAIALPAALLSEGRLGDALDEFSSSFETRGPSWLPFDRAGSTVVRTGSPGLSQELRWKGRLQLNDAETEVLGVDGPLHFRERRGALLREWKLTPSAEGLHAEYLVDGKVQDLDAEGKAWVAAMLKMAAEATLPVGPRARRVFEREGLPGLQRWLAEANHDHQRRGRIEAVAGLLPAQQTPPAHADLLLVAADAVGGDFERRHTLEALVTRLPLDEAQWRQVLVLATRIDGDFEATELQQVLLPRLPASLQTEWLRSIDGIGGDFERRRALEAVLQRPDAPDWLNSVLLAARALSGGHEQQQLLQRVAERLPNPVPLALGLPVAEAAQRISGDFERREALLALLARQPREPEILRAVLRAGSGLGGFERLQLLQGVAPLLPADGSLHADYRALARGLSSHERGEAEQALDR